MWRPGRRLLGSWVAMGPRFLPFADVATPDLPLSRLLRLSLFQLSVGMALVLLIGTLNRVMIVELGVPTWLVAGMLSLPLVFAPFRALIGHRSDTHRCELGWRRVPFIWKGTLLQFGGFAIMPFALLVLAGQGEAHLAPAWIGHAAAALAFLLVGAGVHTVQTAGLALACDLTPPASHPKVVGLMYVTLLAGMLISALVFGALLEDFAPGRLVQVVQGVAVLTVALNVTAMWQQESIGRSTVDAHARDPDFLDAWSLFMRGENARRRLLIVGLGTLAFGMADVLLEPFGGDVLQLSVSSTTRLTALLAGGGLLGFALASRLLGRGMNPYRMVLAGVTLGVLAFALVIASAPLAQPALFPAGNALIGFSAALFGHGTLTATMHAAPREQAGLALGAWGAVQATAAGVAIAISGIVRDAVGWIAAQAGAGDPALGYVTVYSLEIALLLLTLVVAAPLLSGNGAAHRSRTVVSGTPA